jgi:hypothetical protein
MRLDQNVYCSVVFSGAVLLENTRLVTVHRMDGTQESFENPHYGSGTEAIRALSPFFGDFVGDVHFVKRPSGAPDER